MGAAIAAGPGAAAAAVVRTHVRAAKGALLRVRAIGRRHRPFAPRSHSSPEPIRTTTDRHRRRSSRSRSRDRYGSSRRPGDRGRSRERREERAVDRRPSPRYDDYRGNGGGRRRSPSPEAMARYGAQREVVSCGVCDC